MPLCGLPSVAGRDLQEVCPSDEEDQGTSKDTEHCRKTKEKFQTPNFIEKVQHNSHEKKPPQDSQSLSVGVPVILDGLGSHDKRLVP